MNYNNYHNLYKIPYFTYDKIEVIEIKKRFYTYYSRTYTYSTYKKDIKNIRTNFINNNFPDLTYDEKDILLKNLIKAEEFAPTERY